MQTLSTISVREVDRDNWQTTLQLTVHPEQQHFVSDYAPTAAIALAKAYICPGGLTWTPYAFYAADKMIGFTILAYEPESSENYWIYHFFIDQHQQRKGYGKQALRVFLHYLREHHPRCKALQLTVHPENEHAIHLYTGFGFQPTGAMSDGEAVYKLLFATSEHPEQALHP